MEKHHRDILQKNSDLLVADLELTARLLSHLHSEFILSTEDVGTFLQLPKTTERSVLDFVVKLEKNDHPLAFRTFLRGLEISGQSEIKESLWPNAKQEEGSRAARPDLSDLSALQKAVELNDVKEVEELIDAKENVHVIHEETGQTLLHRAARHNNVLMLKILLEAGVEANHQDARGQAAIHVAFSSSNIDTARYLIDHRKVTFTIRDKLNRSAIYMACEFGDTYSVESLLREGAELTENTLPREWKPFHVASNEGHTSIVPLLLKHNADINIQSGQGKTPLYVASWAGRIEMVRFLLDKGADVDCKTNFKFTALHAACRAGHPEVVKLLLDNGANIHHLNGEGYTPLHSASCGGHPEVVKLLLDNKADIHHKKNNKGYTPLHSACLGGKHELVPLLLNRGANIHAKSNDGHTPLHSACFEGHTEVARILLKCGADKYAKDGKDRTPMDSAYRKGHVDAVKVLSEYGALDPDRFRGVSADEDFDWRQRPPNP